MASPGTLRETVGKAEATEKGKEAKAEAVKAREARQARQEKAKARKEKPRCSATGAERWGT